MFGTFVLGYRFWFSHHAVNVSLMRRFLEAVASTSVFAESWEHLQPARQTEQLQQRLRVDVLLGAG
jgi:hypothetical protein